MTRHTLRAYYNQAVILGLAEIGLLCSPNSDDREGISLKCQSCGFENPTGSAFCEECGNSLQPAGPACGSEIRTGARFCRSCGGNLGEAIAAQPVAAAPAAQTGVPPIGTSV